MVVDGIGAPTVVVASDAFKGSLTSLEVADAVRRGVRDVVPAARVVVVPVADGGEGTVAAAVAAGWVPVPVPVHGPTGEHVTATIAVRPDEWGVRGLSAAAPRLSSAAPPASGPDPAASHLGSAAPPEHLLPGGHDDPPRPTVLVELADACGLGRLPGGVPAPLSASSRGLGEAVLAALDLGAEEVVVGVGGSASTDGGAGLLAALGARVLDASGEPLPDGGAALLRVDRLDLTGLDPRLARTRLVLAADVDSPLLGPSGAAAVFAPQKGATPDDVAVLERALTRWAEAVEDATAAPRPDPGARSTNWSKLPQPHTPDPGARSTNWSKLPQPHTPDPGARSTYWSKLPRGEGRGGGVATPGAGAAGGVGFALLAVLGAERRPGVDVVLDLAGLDAALAGADLVVTGEGSLDAQTLAGKAVTGVARRAEAHGIPAVAVCGRLGLAADRLPDAGLRAAYPLSDLEPDPERSTADARALLRRTGARIAREWLSAPPA